MRFEDIATRANEVRREGQEVVLVLGLGFVGTAVVANLARTRRNGKNVFFVIGLDQDTKPGREKAERLDQGHSPTYADDPSLEEVIERAAAAPRQVAGSIDPRVISLADVVVSCINLDLARASGQTDELACHTEGYAEAMRMVGKHMRPGTLVCVESTLPLGMCDQILYPALCDGQKAAGVDIQRDPPAFAYCYERVMPGPNYLDSVNNYWRAYAGVDEASSEKARVFLSKYVNIAEYPLWKHKSIRAAEMSKLLENSYRATNIAFIEEWARLAEQAGVDLFDVIHSIRVRKGTHDNMMLPGLGVGGYCLTKDALLAAYGAENILKVDAALPFSRRAILTNETMPLRAVELIEAHFGTRIGGKKACLFGVTYRPGVGDTRSSPSEIVARALMKRGVDVVAYDPLVKHWEEMPEVPMAADPDAAIRGVDIVVVCLPDGGYKKYLPALLESSLSKGSIVVDPWNMVANSSAQKFVQRGIALHVFGRGDVPTARREAR